MARHEEGLVGFVSGYRVPDQPDTLFVWQIAVHGDARGAGLAGKMIEHILERPSSKDIKLVEATVSPSNAASRRVFERLAERLGGAFERRDLFTTEHFGGADHEPEELIRVGPFELSQERTE